MTATSSCIPWSILWADSAIPSNIDDKSHADRFYFYIHSELKSTKDRACQSNSPYHTMPWIAKRSTMMMGHHTDLRTVWALMIARFEDGGRFAEKTVLQLQWKPLYSSCGGHCREVATINRFLILSWLFRQYFYSQRGVHNRKFQFICTELQAIAWLKIYVLWESVDHEIQHQRSHCEPSRHSRQ